MDKNKIKSFIIKLVILMIGNIISALGIALFYAVNIGTDPISVLVDGQHNLLKLSYGNVTLINNIIWIIYGFIFARKYLKIGTIVIGLTTGYFLDLFVSMFEKLIQPSTTYLVKAILLIPAVMLLALGTAMVINLDVGVGTWNLLILSIRDKTKIQIKWIKITLDFIYTITGYLMGGIIGLGTIVGVVLTGPLIDFFIPICDKANGVVLKKDK